METQLVKIHPVFGEGTIKGYATVKRGEFTFRSIKIIQQDGQKPGIQLPHQQAEDGNWYPLIQCENKSIADAIKTEILNNFNNEVNKNEVS